MPLRCWPAPTRSARGTLQYRTSLPQTCRIGLKGLLRDTQMRSPGQFISLVNPPDVNLRLEAPIKTAVRHPDFLGSHVLPRARGAALACMTVSWLVGRFKFANSSGNSARTSTRPMTLTTRKRSACGARIEAVLSELSIGRGRRSTSLPSHRRTDKPTDRPSMSAPHYSRCLDTRPGKEVVTACRSIPFAEADLQTLHLLAHG